ncbi:MAG: hypothetical protein FWE90_10365 [Defluviitaleaceae bacterium]|nr:hypothetical protein [Defluviitaleaceae bacterium]
MKRVLTAAAMMIIAVLLTAFTIFADTGEETGEAAEADIPPPMPYETVIGTDEILFSNVPNGMITNDPVFLMFPMENVSITRNGLPFAYIPGTPIETAGQYVVSVTMELQLRLDVHHFRIVTTPVNDLVEFTAPDGFIIEEALIDGIAMQITDPRVFPVFDDSEYRLTFAREGTRYTVTVRIKRTPPQLVFMRMLETGHMQEIFISEDGDSFFEGPIAFAPHEQGDDVFTIQTVLNRSAYNPANNTLTEPGRYRVTVTDQAGNSTAYTFRILYVMDVPTVWIIIIASVMLVLLGVYLIHNRMTLRVR